jgi:hypothetical protein
VGRLVRHGLPRARRVISVTPTAVAGAPRSQQPSRARRQSNR